MGGVIILIIIIFDVLIYLPRLFAIRLAIIPWLFVIIEGPTAPIINAMGYISYLAVCNDLQPQPTHMQAPRKRLIILDCFVKSIRYIY